MFHRTQSPHFYLSQDSKSSLLSFIGLKVLCCYAFIGLKVLCHLHFKDFNVFCLLHLQDFNVFYLLHFKDFNVFCLLYLQDFNVFCLLHLIRLQHLLSFIGLNVLVFVLLKTQHPLFLCSEKKTSNVFCSTGLQCPPFYVL